MPEDNQVTDKATGLDMAASNFYKFLKVTSLVLAIASLVIATQLLFNLNAITWIGIAIFSVICSIGLNFFIAKQKLPENAHIKNMIADLSNRVTKLEA